MTTLALDLRLGAPPPEAGGAGPGARRGEPSGDAPPAADVRGRRTLDELIVGVWEDLSAHRAVDCPVCRDTMRPRYGAGAAPVGGRCDRCRSALG
jgi:hypothetical protein